MKKRSEQMQLHGRVMEAETIGKDGGKREYRINKRAFLIFEVYLLIFCVVSTILTSCKNGNGDPIGDENVDVYVAGYNDYGQAVLWKNGDPISLSGGSIANSVFVSESDVYITGYEPSTTFGVKTVLWKNENPTILAEEGSNTINSVFVARGNVYVAGNNNDPNRNDDGAVLWKNGIPTILTAGVKSESASSVFVAGNDVYVTGAAWYNEDVAGITSWVLPTLWKNGVPSILTIPTHSNIGFSSCTAGSVFVANNNVYIVGVGTGGCSSNYRDITIAILWKNGIPTFLTDENEEMFFNGQKLSEAYSVYVDGSDIYVAGAIGTFINNYSDISWSATLWKNGVPIALDKNFYATSVFVSGSDIYVVEGGNGAILWKNGVSTYLSKEASAWPNSIFVAPRQ